MTNNPTLNRIQVWLNGALIGTRNNVFTNAAGAHVTIGGHVWNGIQTGNLFKGRLIAMRTTRTNIRYTEPFYPPSRFATSA